MRAGALRALLTSAGARFVDGSRPLRTDVLPQSARAELVRLFDELGGDRQAMRLAPGGWDLRTADGVAIELDEQFHFTRYRAATLRSPLLSDLPWTATYLGYCTQFERAATRGGGKRWTSPSTEKMFGPSDPVGVFGQHGSARAKQRALYDAMKDLAAAAGAVRLARISIYDQIGGATIDDILYGKSVVAPAEILRYVESRVHAAEG